MSEMLLAFAVICQVHTGAQNSLTGPQGILKIQRQCVAELWKCWALKIKAGTDLPSNMEDCLK